MQTYSMTVKQLVLLAAYQGWDALVGIPDPFLGHLAEQVLKEWEDCRSRLKEKGYLLESDGKTMLSPEMVNMLAVCCEPGTFIAMQNQTGDSGVSVCAMPEINQIVLLRYSEGEVTIHSFIQESFPIDEILNDVLKIPNTALDFCPFVISRDLYDLISKEADETSVILLSGASNLGVDITRRVCDALSGTAKKLWVIVGSASGELDVKESYGISIGLEGGIKIMQYTEQLNDMVEISPASGLTFSIQ